MKRISLLILASIAAGAVAVSGISAGTLKDLENKVRKGQKAGEAQRPNTRGNCLLKVTKKTAAFQGVGTVKFYYVTFHADSSRPLTVKFSARGKNDEEFELPESGWGGSTTTGEQWEWEKNKGFLPKYFDKTKEGRRIAKFEQNVPLIKKHGQIKAYKVDLLDNNTLIDTIRWNWDDTPYQRGLGQKSAS